jgi:hypothetical protein
MWRSRLLPTATVGVLAALAMSVNVDAAQATTGATGSGKGHFSHPTRITSHWFPLRPGTQFTYDGTVTDDTGTHKHRVIFTVTDVVKVINGVKTRAIWDQDINDGRLTEAELAFFAQDDQGNVWTMGEYPEEYEAGRFVGAPSTWINGVAKAKAGILVPGHPVPGTPSFVQGRAPSIDFYDIGKVVRDNVRICVRSGCYCHTAVIDESSPTAPEHGHQQKYYAPGVGLVDIKANSGDAREDLQLTSVRHLGAKALAAASAQALRLDRRAYRYAAAMYRRTAHAYRQGR